jgi:L-asparaginase
MSPRGTTARNGNARARHGVLVIVAGGNIGLYADRDDRSGWVVRAASVAEIAEAIIGEAPSFAQRAEGTLTLREHTVEGHGVHVTFEAIGDANEREALDSAQVDPERWEKLAATIHDNYNNYEGFVILHGLDTMAYTASALAFMLGNPVVPIVLTGAQRPLNYGRTDAIQNATSAIAIAAGESLEIQPVVKEVSVYSHDTLFRGNRVTMSSSSSYRSFDSPNYPPLAIAGENIEVQRHVLRRATREHFEFRKDAQARVVIVDVFPGMDATLIESLKDRGPLVKGDAEDGSQGDHVRGVLLRTYGLGTAPTSDDSFLTALEELVKAEIVVMNVTQARSGRISYGTDPVSLRLMEQGVVSGVDMTAEAAYAKMVVLLSETDIEKEGDSRPLADALQIALCGEQSQSVFNLHFRAGETRMNGDGEFEAPLRPLEAIVGRRELSECEGDIEHVTLRLLGVRPKDRSSRPIDLQVHLADTQQRREDEIKLGQEVLRWQQGSRETQNFTYDIKRDGWQYVTAPTAGDTAFVRLTTSEPISWTRLSIALFVNTRSTAS